MCLNANTHAQHSSHAMPLEIEFDFVVLNTYHTSSIDTHLFGFIWLYSLFCFTFSSICSPFSSPKYLSLSSSHILVRRLDFDMFQFYVDAAICFVRIMYMHIYVYNAIDTLMHMACHCLSKSSMPSVWMSVSVCCGWYACVQVYRFRSFRFPFINFVCSLDQSLFLSADIWTMPIQCMPYFFLA